MYRMARTSIGLFYFGPTNHCCRVFDPLVWQDHKPQPDGVTAARVDVREILLQDFYALFCSRWEMYLCVSDNLAFVKKWMYKDSQPGARLRRGYREPENEVTFDTHMDYGF